MKKLSYLKISIYALVVDWFLVVICFLIGLSRNFLKDENRSLSLRISDIADKYLNWFHGFMHRVFFREFFPVIEISEGSHFVPSYGELFLFHLFCGIQTVAVALLLAVAVNWLIALVEKRNP